jgi:hypothetical protein
VNSSQDEAIGILKEVIDNFFTSQAIDLKNVLRRCAHVCEILNWSGQLAWFQNELFGYPSGFELPWYRRSIKGRIDWLATGGFEATLNKVIEDQHKLNGKPTKYTQMDVFAGIDWVLSVSQSGYVESAGKKSREYISFIHKSIETEKVKIYDKQVFQTILTNIENEAFNFVSKSYALLRYGDVLQGIWEGYRTKVDEKLTSIGFGGHIDAIRTGLNSDNSQDWKTAMWSCRDVLRDVASYLWQDPRETYAHLKGKGKGGKLRVTQGDYVNRLGAYLHQKGITGETRAYLRDEMERIYNSIQTLNDLDNKAHGEITQHDARTAAIGTYIILGELATRTDMQPVKKYQSP